MNPAEPDALLSSPAAEKSAAILRRIEQLREQALAMTALTGEVLGEAHELVANTGRPIGRESDTAR